jgi:hypothetical protein
MDSDLILVTHSIRIQLEDLVPLDWRSGKVIPHQILSSAFRFYSFPCMSHCLI